MFLICSLKAYSVKGFVSILVLLKRMEELRDRAQWEVLAHCAWALKGNYCTLVSSPGLILGKNWNGFL